MLPSNTIIDDEPLEFGNQRVSFPQISDDPGEVFDRFGVSFQPALVIVDTDGSTELVAGAVDEELLGQIISEAS